MAIEIQCPACMDQPDLRPLCHMCRGTGMIVDTGAPPGAQPYRRRPEVLARIPALLAATDGGLAVAASDGTLWVGGPSDSGGPEEWEWHQLPNLPQPAEES